MKPIIVVSRCFEFDSCRYNGEVMPSRFVRHLKKRVQFVPICPELEIGLGVPRDIITIVEEESGSVLFQPSTGRDLTETMTSFSDRFLEGLKDVDGFILKARSPSCGLSDVKVAASRTDLTMTRGGVGFFARAVLRHFPHCPVEDEDRLSHSQARGRFLARVFLSAELRSLRKSGNINELIEFHSRNKHLSRVCDAAQMRELNQILAETTDQSFSSVLERYEAVLFQAVSNS